jgi:hypothetical protein
MTWWVKWRTASGAAPGTLCDEPSQVIDLFDEQKAMGRDPWIEDADGRLVNRESFDA